MLTLTVWDGRLSLAPALRGRRGRPPPAPSAPAGGIPALEGEGASEIVKLCGRQSVQVAPAGPRAARLRRARAAPRAARPRAPLAAAPERRRRGRSLTVFSGRALRRARDRRPVARPRRSTTATSGAERVRRIRIEDLLASPEEIAALRERCSRAGASPAIPTETFYGLAADPRSEAGVARDLRAQAAGRRQAAARPLRRAAAARRRSASRRLRTVLDRFFAIWPAPLTVVLPLARADPRLARRARRSACGCRRTRALRDLLARVGPVTGTSVNRSGEPPLLGSRTRSRRLCRREIDVLVDGGRTPGGLAVDARSTRPSIRRACCARARSPWPSGAPLIPC